MQMLHDSSKNKTSKIQKQICSVDVVTENSLECEVAMRTRAEVLGVVQTNHLARTTSTGDARQVAGGPTLAALPLLVWEHLIINLL